MAIERSLTRLRRNSRYPSNASPEARPARGFVVTPLGLPELVENAWTMAATIDIRRETLDALHDRIGMDSIVQQDGPRLDAVARANLCGLAAAQRKSA